MQRFTESPAAQAARYLVVTLATVASLAMVWEFKLEALVTGMLGIPYDNGFETAERWRFVSNSALFAAIALVFPSLRIRGLLSSQRRAFSALRTEQAHNESLARHDPLTGLINRRVFIESLQGMLDASSDRVAVVLIDLDRFKPINDTYGHAAGDRVLCEIGTRLRILAAQYDGIASRLGGDEFALLLSGLDADALSRFASDALGAMRAPLASVHGKLTVGAAIGISQRSSDAGSAQELLVCADHAMYRAKQAQRNGFQFYEEQYEREQRQRAQFEADVIAALESSAFEPYFQPIVSLPDAQLAGFEILARWPHPQLGMRFPDTFIPVVERLGLMHELTFSLLSRAIIHARRWPESLTLSVNVTAQMLEDEQLPDRLFLLLTELDFPCARLEVEVTEQALVKNVSVVRQTLQKLRERGVTVALDDFGTGYSSIFHLTQLAIDKIKIDRSFFCNPNVEESQIVAVMLGLSKGLKKKTTAEGVETAELAKLLGEKGCDYAQGYYFGKPMSAEDLHTALSECKQTA